MVSVSCNWVLDCLRTKIDKGLLWKYLYEWNIVVRKFELNFIRNSLGIKKFEIKDKNYSPMWKSNDSSSSTLSKNFRPYAPFNLQPQLHSPC